MSIVVAKFFGNRQQEFYSAPVVSLTCTAPRNQLVHFILHSLYEIEINALKTFISVKPKFIK